MKMTSYKLLSKIQRKGKRIINKCSIDFSDVEDIENLTFMVGTIEFYLSNLEKINNSIHKLFRKGNIVAISILLRSEIEHYFIITYLFKKFVAKKEIKIWKDFVMVSLADELTKDSKARLKSTQFIEPEIKIDYLEIIKKVIPHIKDLSKKELSRLSLEYSFSSILKKELEQIDSIEKIESNSFIYSLAKKYSDLSSFVHGGYYASYIINERYSKESKKNNLLNDITISLQMYYSAYLQALLLYSAYNKDSLIYYQKLDKIFKSIPE